MASYTYKHKSGHTVTYGQPMPKLESSDDWSKVTGKKPAAKKSDDGPKTS